MRTALSILIFVAAANAGERSYTMLLAGHNAGSMVVKQSGNTRDVVFEYNDRGRGPHLETHLELGADGLPQKTENRGHDYLKVPVDERFSVENGRARWKSAAEKGDATAGGFFLGMYSPPEEFGLLVKKLAAAPQHKIALYPAGEARLEPLGQEVSGLTGYLVFGLGFTPTPVWMGSDGELFASGEEWQMIIKKGEESKADALITAQNRTLQARERKMASELAHRPKGALVIRDVRLFDARHARMIDHQTVVVRGTKIEAVGASPAIPDGAEIIEGKGKTLAPGLWDMHVHVDDVDGPLNIAAGVTTVRDLANDIDKLARLRKSWDEGTAIGPRVIAAGFVDGRGPFAAPTKVFADTPEEARAVVDKYAKLGYVQIKIYSSVKPELVKVIAKEAHARGLRVSGHIPAFMTAAEAVRDGYDEIQHANMLVLNFLKDVKDTRGPERFTAVAEHAVDLDLKSKEVRDFIKLLVDHHTVIDPTLTVFEGMFKDRPGEMSHSFAEVADQLPAQVRRGLLAGGLPVTPDKEKRYNESFNATRDLVRALHEAGVPVVAGTDGLCGFTLHRELELYQAMNLKPAEILQLATFGAAQIMKRDDLGVIEPGKLADLVLYDKDPSQFLTSLRKPALVVKDGVMFRPSEIDKQLGIKP